MAEETKTREELRARLEELQKEVQTRKVEIRALAAELERRRPHVIGPSGIPSAEKFGNLGGKP